MFLCILVFVSVFLSLLSAAKNLAMVWKECGEYIYIGSEAARFSGTPGPFLALPKLDDQR